MIQLLDEYIPFVAGSEINDDPLAPISRFARDLIAEKGDATPIEWLHRNERFFEKLATPDVTIADIIGDVDPIKAANLKLSYADERVIHFGMIPRANRSIFVINELPDLQARIQVALFNILQEGDIQIRGFKLRMNLDIQFIFTANPEDYTNRGSIVTPLKDRIGSQILTHYPKNIAVAKKITEQEARINAVQSELVYVPNLAKDIIEQISFEARASEYIDAKSGVSARMTISAMENLISTAERRALKNGLNKTAVRLSDFMGIIPAITGKVELVYEGEQEGAEVIANLLIEKAISTLFKFQFPKISKLEKQNEKNAYSDLLDWFIAEGGFELYEDFDEKQYKKVLDEVKPLDALMKKYAPDTSKEDAYFMKEFILWALVENKKLNKEKLTEGFSFKDILGHMINKL
jgi:magnesium chelatase subunit I